MTKKKDGKSKVKVGKLSVKKETVKDLENEEMNKIKGGYFDTANCDLTQQTCFTCAGKTCGRKCRP